MNEGEDDKVAVGDEDDADDVALFALLLVVASVTGTVGAVVVVLLSAGLVGAAWPVVIVGDGGMGGVVAEMVEVIFLGNGVSIKVTEKTKKK